ncbi:MAG: FG-GAP repeat domain-containing protein, partial [Candidatus Sumerlaeota bacterium]
MSQFIYSQEQFSIVIGLFDFTFFTMVDKNRWAASLSAKGRHAEKNGRMFMIRCHRYAILRLLLLFWLAAFPLGAQEAEERLGLERPVAIKAHKQAGLLRAGDMNSDGRLDFLTVLNSRGLLQVYIQKQEVAGVRTFEKHEYVLSDNLVDMVVMDWDGDGRDDVIMSTSDQALGVRLQQVDGSLAAMEKIGENARYLLADDIDGD